MRIRATANYSGAMIGRGVWTAAVLALCATGGALLGGCGVGTKTVTVSGASAPTTTPGGSAGGAATSPRTATSPSTTTGGGSHSGAGQRASTTRTAPAPAFTHTGAASGEAASGASVAAAVVRAHGYTPGNVSDYHPTQTLRVLLGTRSGSADGYDQRAFFFLDGRYLGTDSSQPSASIHVVSQSDTEVALAYALYRSHDSLCCPSGGQAIVHFQLNDGTLLPLQPLPRPAPRAASPGSSEPGAPPWPPRAWIVERAGPFLPILVGALLHTPSEKEASP